MAHNGKARRPYEYHADLPALTRPRVEPVENLWQYLRGNWLSNRVFGTYDAIIDAACQAWMNILGEPEIITSIGMRDWAHVGQSL